jgi:hypothetical protein
MLSHTNTHTDAGVCDGFILVLLYTQRRMRIIELAREVAKLEATDFILMERNISESIGVDGYSVVVAENNKRILDIMKTLHLTVKVAKKEKEEENG